MSKPILILVLLAAAVGVFWLLGGPAWLGGGPDGGGTGGAGDGDTGLLEGGGAGEATDEEAESAAKGPTLFGRARSQRVGQGGLIGLVKDFRSGEPVGGAAIVIVGSGYGEEAVSLQATTGADGRFDLREIAAGDRYQLHVRGPDQYQRSYPSVSVDADFEKDLGTIWLGESGKLEGKVLGLGGKPVADAEVQIHGGGGSMIELIRNFTKLFEQLDKDAEPLMTAKTDASGRFAVPKLEPGPITLIVRAAGHQQKTQTVVMTSKGAAGGAVQVQLDPSDPLIGVVVDDRGRGIGEARVACLDKDDMNSVLYGRQFSLTDADGRFRIDSPPAGGEFALIVTAEGYPMLLTEAKAGADTLRLVLESGVEVLVRILEKDTERPVEDAHVMCMFGVEEALGSDNMNIASGVTDQRGEATLMARTGKLQMLFLNHAEKGSGMFAPMMAAMGATGILTGPEDTSIQPPRTTLEFHVQTGVVVSGRVLDEQGAGVAGARVVTMGSMGLGGNALSGEDGSYEILNQSTPVTAVVASKAGYTQDFEGFGGVKSQPGEPVTHDVKMKRAATISGRVVDGGGRPMQGVRVKPTSEGGMAMIAAFTGGAPESITNKEGRYVLSSVPPAAEGSVMGRMAGWLDSKSGTFQIKGGAANQAPDLVMRKGARLTVRVEDPEGVVVRGARVEVDVDTPDAVEFDPMESFGTFADHVTRAGGEVEVRDLPNGEATLTASKEGFAANRVVMELKLEGRDDDQTVVVRLREAFALRGRVVDMDGKPAAKVRVMCNPIQYGQPPEPGAPWAPNANAVTDTEGRFEIPGMPDVPLTLELSGDGYQGETRKLAGPRGAAEIRIARMDAGAKARIDELQKELMKTYQQWASAKTEDEKKAIGLRMQQIQMEKAALESGKSLEGAKQAAADAPALGDGD